MFIDISSKSSPDTARAIAIHVFDDADRDGLRYPDSGDGREFYDINGN
jgi:hypothetical protein